MLAAGGSALRGQTESVKSNTVSKPDPDAILHELAPENGPPDSLKLNPAQKEKAIRLLLIVKHNETGWNQQLAEYLLATLGFDYQQNRDELLRVWRGCVVKGFDRDCDEDTLELLVHLSQHGDKTLLRPILAGWRYSDGALSEGLGTFISDQLERNPKDLVAALETFSPRAQRGICELGGSADGGGMGPKTARKVLSNLKAVGGEVSERCAHGVRVGNGGADKANSDLPAEDTKK
jgi:hypothetical protein